VTATAPPALPLGKSDRRVIGARGTAVRPSTRVEQRALGFTIGAASKLIGVSPSTVRAWEREGLVQSTRSASGYRYFGEEQIARLRRISYLRNVENLNASAIKRLLPRPKAGVAAPSRNGQVALGAHLRRLRKGRSLTLEQASSGSGLSASFLSALERDRTGVTPATLKRLVQFYGATMNSMLREAAPPIAQLKRRGHRRAIRNEGYVLEQLVDGKTLMDATLVSVKPGGGSGGAYSHEGEEFLYVLEGFLEVVLDGREQYELRQGDTLYYPSTMKHGWRNLAPSTTRVLWVATPPTF